MKILFVNPHLKMGGIANSLYNLLAELKGHKELEIELLCFNPYFDDKFSSLYTHLKIHSPFFLKCLYINFKDAKEHLAWYSFPVFLVVKLFSKIIGDNASRKFFIKLLNRNWNRNTQYDAAISFTNDIPKNNALMGSNDFVLNSVNAKDKIAWIHNDLESLGITKPYILERYKDFDKIVSVSQSCKADFDSLAPEFSEKSFLVHNFIDPKVILQKSLEFNPYPKKKDSFIFVTVARIDNNQKRIDRILEIAKKLKENGELFQWYIVGDGPDRLSLESQALSLNLENYLFFEGFRQNPYPYVKNADCFVLASDYEAQGMVLSEALIVGTPVITTDFPAAKEFVIEGKNGKITARNTQALFEAVESVLRKPEDLKLFREQIQGSHLENMAESSLREFKDMLVQ
ncbi:MAG TPA: glycosyltransferase [Aequorivita sp.]|nr:glycosyltransferase [Aequorivita sp.]